jgi:uncharacterized protein (UPF0548 family)
MFQLKRPSQDEIIEFLSHQERADFSYPEVGASRARPPAGYNVDHNRIKLGNGREVFARAIEAMKTWQMFNLDWVYLAWPNTPICVGATVAIIVHHFSFWSLNCCRIVYLIDEDQPIQKFGFAYGTLSEHGERGEERFSVELHHQDNSVWYDLFAFSQPNHLLARVGYPITRMLQKRFARDSKLAMYKAVNK